MYFEIIKSSLLVVIWAILATIALYLIVLFALRYFNKYNVRNTWFILLSIIAIPFFIIEFSMAFALLKVKNTVVVEAQNYACCLADQIDHVKGNVTNLVHEQVTDRIDQITTQIGDSVIHESEEVMDMVDIGLPVQDTLETTVGIKVEQAVTMASTAVTETTASMVNTTLDYIPENPVGKVLEKFPILANFLDEHDISGNNATEIVNAVFIKTNNYILSLIVGCLKWIGYFLLVLCSFSVLFGFLKKRRKEKAKKKKEMDNKVEQ